MEPNNIPCDMIDVELHSLGTQNARLRKVNAALLEALEAAVKTLSVANLGDKSLYAAPVTVAARAAIAQARGDQS